MTSNDDIVDLLLDNGRLESESDKVDDFAQFLLTHGRSNTKHKSTQSASFNKKSKPLTPKQRPGKSQTFGPTKIPKPSTPNPHSPTQQRKSFFRSVLKSIFWIGLVSFALVKYFYKETGNPTNENDRSKAFLLDTLASLRRGNEVISAENLVHGESLIRSIEWADSIIILDVLKTGIHQFYIDEGMSYKAYEGYVSRDGQMVGRGSYDLKYSKMTKYLNIDNKFYNEVRGSCSFVSVLSQPMDIEIEVRGCDIVYDHDDDLTEVVYVYNSPDDPMVLKRRIGVVLSNAFAKKSNVKSKSALQENDLDRKFDAPSHENTVLKESTSEDASNKENSTPIRPQRVETFGKLNYSIGEPHSSGFIFSLNQDWGQGKIYRIVNSEVVSWPMISVYVSEENEGDIENSCCSWRLPSTDELRTLFQNSKHPRLMEGTYWTSSNLMNIEIIADEHLIETNLDGNRIIQKSLIAINSSTGQVNPSTKFEKHYFVLVRDFSFNPN